MRRPLTDDPLRALLVTLNPGGTWVKSLTLPIPPFPGLGIRLDTYDMVEVISVVVGDVRYDVTCFVKPESGATWTDQTWEKVGFEPGSYP